MKSTLSKRLVEARTKKKLTQERLSELSGVSISAISRIENGKGSATIETLCRLAAALDIGLDSLLYDYFPENTFIQNPDIKRVVSIMESLGEEQAKYIAEIVCIYEIGQKK